MTGAMNLCFGVPYHNKTIDQCRAIGRIGGLRSARTRRLRRDSEAPVPATTTPEPEPETETARQAIDRIDALCPWLIGAERRTAQRQTA